MAPKKSRFSRAKAKHAVHAGSVATGQSTGRGRWPGKRPAAKRPATQANAAAPAAGVGQRRSRSTAPPGRSDSPPPKQQREDRSLRRADASYAQVAAPVRLGVGASPSRRVQAAPPRTQQAEQPFKATEQPAIAADGMPQWEPPGENSSPVDARFTSLLPVACVLYACDTLGYQLHTS